MDTTPPLSPSSSDPSWLEQKEYEYTWQYRLHYSGLRPLVVGGTLTIASVIIGLSNADDFFVTSINAVLMLGLAWITIATLGTFNRGIYVFLNDAAWLQQKYGVVGYSRYWKHYMQANPQDSGTYAFTQIAHVINFGAMIYALLVTWYSATRWATANVVLTGATTQRGITVFAVLGLIALLFITAGAIVVYRYNLNLIKTGLVMKGYMSRIEANLDAARQQFILEDGTQTSNNS